MAAVDATAVSPEELQAKAWEGFAEGNWQKDIDVRDFIQKNYTPYEGDESFLADATEKTKHLWQYLDDNYLAVERKQRVYDVDTHTPAGIDAFGAGYIDSPEVDNVVVGLQTDVPCKRAMMPNGGWRMVEQAIKEAGKEPDPEIKKIFTKYRKTHNDGVFGVYTKQIKVSRHIKILTGLPDAYGRGRIIGDYRRVALYGVNTLIKFKQRDKDSVPYRNDFTEPEIEHWIRFREEHDEQIKALMEQNQSEVEALYYSTLQSISASLTSVQSNIDNLQSQMDALNTGANDYYIYAPTSGVIHMDTPYKVGMVLSAGTPLATVASENSDLEVVAYVTLNDRPLLHVGDPCKIAITGLSEYSYGTLTGTVTSIDSDVTSSNSTSCYKMTIKPDATYVVRRSGDKVDLANCMSVTARVEYDQVTYFEYAMEALGVLFR